MSYILDALRRSEEQRRLASTPDLGTEHRPAGTTRRGNARLFALLGAGLLLNALVVGAWLFWPREPDFASAAPGATVPPADAASGADSGRGEAPADIRGPVGGARAEAGSTTTGFAGAGPAAADGTSTALRPATAAGDAETVPASGFPQDPDSVLSAPAAAAARKSAAPRSAAEPTSTRFPPTDRGPPRPTTPLPSAEPPVPIRALPAEFRQRIGPLSFSTHIYADEARFREVAINGRTHREGARVGALRLIEITEDGVILELEGRRFSVSVLQDWDY